MLLSVKAIVTALVAGLIGVSSAAFAMESKTCQLAAPLYIVICGERCSLSEVGVMGMVKVLKQADSWRQFEPRFHRQPGSSPSERWDASGATTDRRMDKGMLDTPTAMSPDRSWVAAAIAAEDEFDEYGPKEEFVVFTKSSRTPALRMRMNGTVESLAWSPDGAALAVLIGAPAEKPKRGLVDSVAGLFGWRVEHRRGWMEVFDTKGGGQCKVELYSDMKSPTAYAVWPRRSSG